MAPPTVIFKEVKLFMRHLICECGGEMVFTKDTRAGALLPYPHKCETCGRIQNTSETYPHKFFEEIEEVP